MEFRRNMLKLALGAALAGAAGAASATTYVMMRDEPLVDEADAIVRGTVVGVQEVTNGVTETHYAIRVDDNLSPKSSRPTETLVLPGSPPDAPAGLRIHGVPHLRENGKVLVFAQRRPDGHLAPLQLGLGVFGEEATSTGRFYTRSLEGGVEAQKANGDYHKPREAIRFERWVLARARGSSLPVDYLVDPGALGARPKYNLFIGSNYPIRWATFDSGGTVSWTALAGGQVGITAVDEYQLFAQALAAWTNDATSRIQLAYTGQSSAVDAQCGRDGNRLLWNDPQGSIAGSYSCQNGGVLASGGPCYGGTMTANGRTYEVAVEARVTVQDGAACYFNGNGGKNGAEVLTHEIGHTLGFDHACGDSESGSCVPGTPAANATMAALAHGDGRGAFLAPDDVAGALAVYPAPAGSVPPPSGPDLIFATSIE